MISTKCNPTPISSYYAPDLYHAGDIPMPHHSFEDFAMPSVYALIETNTEYNRKFARVYTPNPWRPDEVRFYDWILSSDGIWKRTMGSDDEVHFYDWILSSDGWKRTMGSALPINAARDDWKSREAKGHIPQDVIANPLNGEVSVPWDAFAFHFCSPGTYGFHELIRSYKFDYPRKAK